MLATLRDLTSRLERAGAQKEVESDRFLHDALAALLPKLDVMQQSSVVRVQEDLSWAERIDNLTTAHQQARASWAEAAAAIAKADGIVASEAYRAVPIRTLLPQTGLVPIGMNPVTKLWEFYDLRSAWDGEENPAELSIPEHRPDGSLEVTDDMGIVLVLVPGGTFTMGAYKGPAAAPNVDPAAKREEWPVHEVTLAPFFLARHELTQGQWQRLWIGEDALAQPSTYQAGQKYGQSRHTTTLANPVEQVSWLMSNLLLTQNGMLLPTEAQWEYCCRAGTTTRWACPYEELRRCANLADAAAKETGLATAHEPWDDDYGLHAPVGYFLANALGLYDMHGNVSEWCLDEVGDYAGPVRAGDGLHLKILFAGNHTQRGGSFGWPATEARISTRAARDPDGRDTDAGLRAARAIRL